MKHLRYVFVWPHRGGDDCISNQHFQAVLTFGGAHINTKLLDGDAVEDRPLTGDTFTMEGFSNFPRFEARKARDISKISHQSSPGPFVSKYLASTTRLAAPTMTPSMKAMRAVISLHPPNTVRLDAVAQSKPNHIE